jgi:ABC-type dipeptide/oligopeptide/nickel transport system permease component
LSQNRLLLLHALPNALVKFLPFIGVGLAGVLAGSIFIESVFSWPGVGPFVIDAIKRRDLPVIQGFVLLSVSFYVVSTALTDLAVELIDPARQPGRGGA